MTKQSEKVKNRHKLLHSVLLPVSEFWVYNSVDFYLVFSQLFV